MITGRSTIIFLCSVMLADPTFLYDIVEAGSLLCFTEGKRPVFYEDRESYELCVYSVKATKELFSVTVLENPNCERKDVCFGGCVNSQCLKVGYLQTVLKRKKHWSYRFIWVGSLFMGFSLCVIYMVYSWHGDLQQRLRLKEDMNKEIDSDSFMIEEVDEINSSESGCDEIREYENRLNYMTWMVNKGSRSLSNV